MQDNREIETGYRKAMEATVTYRVGRLVLDARHSLKKMVKLPLELYRLSRQFRDVENQSFPKSRQQSNTAATPDIQLYADALNLISKYSTDVKALASSAQQLSGDDKSFNRLLKASANIASSSDALLASEILQHLTNLDDDHHAQKELAFILYSAGNLSDASTYLTKPEVNALLGQAEQVRARRIIAEAEILVNGIAIPHAIESRRFERQKIMYVCHTSFPHHNNGYAVRTHNVALAIKELGHDIECVSRPGYPWDRKDAREASSIEPASEIDGLKYFRYKTTNVSALPLNEFVEQAAKTLYQHIMDHDISVVMAASNYVNTLPALIAARRAGVKFIYDVRGLWEYSHCSKIKNWEHSERFQLARRMETLACNHAEGVIAISTALKEKLVTRGVLAKKITVALNAASPVKQVASINGEAIRRGLNIPEEATVLGYIGSVEKYEGLHILAEAVASLISGSHNVYMLIVGDGHFASELYERCCELGIVSNVRFTGRLPQRKAVEHYAAIDICVYPRLADKVCETVAPLKPLEAMLYMKPIIVSDIPPIRELLNKEDSSIFVNPGDASDLAKNLVTLIHSREYQSNLSLQNSIFATEHRSWTNTALRYHSMLESQLTHADSSSFL